MRSSDSQQDVDSNQADDSPPPSRFSLHGLSAAFARLTGANPITNPTKEVASSINEIEESDADETAASEVLSPRMIVEGLLFVGDSEGRPLSNRQLAANIRDVSPKEVDILIAELNACYQEAGAPYEIVSEGAGYRLRLRPEFEPIRQRFLGRVREAKLTPQVIEVLSVVAYRQPITADEIGQLRGARSHALLAQLVRRGLLRLDRTADNPRKPAYRTTERFNLLFGVESPRDLPSSEDLDDS